MVQNIMIIICAKRDFFKALRINNTPSCAGVTDSGTAFLSAALLHTPGGVLEAPRGFSVRNCCFCALLSLCESYNPHGRGLLCEHLRVGSVQTPEVVRAARGSSQRGAILDVSAGCVSLSLELDIAGRREGTGTQAGSLSACACL